jgi:hypothetical protein
VVRRGGRRAAEHPAQPVQHRQRRVARGIRLAHAHVRRRAALHAFEDGRAPLGTPGHRMDGDLAAERDADRPDAPGAHVRPAAQVGQRGVGVLLEGRRQARRAAVALAVTAEVEEQDAVAVPASSRAWSGDAEPVAARAVHHRDGAPLREGTYQPRTRGPLAVVSVTGCLARRGRCRARRAGWAGA